MATDRSQSNGDESAPDCSVALGAHPLLHDLPYPLKSPVWGPAGTWHLLSPPQGKWFREAHSNQVKLENLLRNKGKGPKDQRCLPAIWQELQLMAGTSSHSLPPESSSLGRPLGLVNICNPTSFLSSPGLCPGPRPTPPTWEPDPASPSKLDPKFPPSIHSIQQPPAFP